MQLPRNRHAVNTSWWLAYVAHSSIIRTNGSREQLVGGPIIEKQPSLRSQMAIKVLELEPDADPRGCIESNESAKL